MQILERWMEDLPHQFLGQHNIEILISALSKQFQQVYDVLTEINEKTEISKATGINLDLVGSNVGLTRNEAADLYGKSIGASALTDEQYRRCLLYQILVNTNDCTYYELVDGINQISNIGKFTYKEDSRYPATIVLGVDGIPSNDDILKLIETPVIKAAGVGSRMRISTEYRMPSKTGIASKVHYLLKTTMETSTLEYDLLTDENGVALIDNLGNVLY